MSPSVVSVSHISKHFDKVIAVDDVSFDVALRSTTALLGGNGAGKTPPRKPECARLIIKGADPIHPIPHQPFLDVFP